MARNDTNLDKMMKSTVLFLDNEFIPADARLIKRLTPGILKARGVFETMRVYPKAQVFGLSEHLSRLRRGLKVLKIKSPLSEQQIKQALKRILELNHFTNARIRLIVWQENRRVHTAISVFPYDPSTHLQYLKGFQAIISKTKLDDSSLMKEVKSLNYGPFLKAYQRAQARGYDEALLVNHRGELVEGTRSNIFFLKDGKLCTPALRCGCLAGITRGRIIKIARGLGIKVKQVAAAPQEFLSVQEAFLTNSLIEVMPLTSIEGRRLGNGKAGPVTLKILREYRQNLIMN